MGRMTRLIRVICQDSRNITIRTRVTLIRLDTTDDRVSVKACWAPITSLLSRLMRAPVWVRVKKAMGIFWMWLEDLGAHVEDEPLADLGRHPADADGEAVSATARPAATSARADDQGLVVVGDARCR